MRLDNTQVITALVLRRKGPNDLFPSRPVPGVLAWEHLVPGDLEPGAVSGFAHLEAHCELLAGLGRRKEREPLRAAVLAPVAGLSPYGPRDDHPFVPIARRRPGATADPGPDLRRVRGPLPAGFLRRRLRDLCFGELFPRRQTRATRLLLTAALPRQAGPPEGYPARGMH